MPTEAYASVEEVSDEGELVKNFIHIPSDIEATEEEEIGIEHLLRDIKDVSVGDLSKQVSNKIQSLKTFTSKVDDMWGYLEEVIDNKLPVNADIIKQI